MRLNPHEVRLKQTLETDDGGAGVDDGQGARVIRARFGVGVLEAGPG